MMTYWLLEPTTATITNLVEALQSPSVGLETLATKVKRKFQMSHSETE